ncbi:MAG TPA: hypothetical protein VFC70_04005 [Oscillospiraceae bacterium]|nr:hypothetical protein [Oscillospiraceae bacterium]
MKAAVTLTPEESRRLIAKAVVQMDVVKRAKETGIIALPLCSTAGFVAEEIIGEQINLEHYYCGFIHADGWCRLAPEVREPGRGQLIIVKGEPKWLDFPKESIRDYIAELGPNDVVVKSGNIIDADGKVGMLVGDPDGGEAGRYLHHIISKGINSIVPMTINKTLPVQLDDLVNGMGTKVLQRKHTYGLTCGVLPWFGTIVTEIESFKWLTGADALPCGAGGFGSGAGCVSFLLQGPEVYVENAWNLVREIKGEPILKTWPGDCKQCSAQTPESPLTCSARRKSRKK